MQEKKKIVELDQENYSLIRSIAFKNEKTIKSVTNYLIRQGLSIYPPLKKEGE